MKLLFDQNLSPRLVSELADIHPSSSHVFQHGLDADSDEAVWQFARTNGFCIVTKDRDFLSLSVLRGDPPKVIRLRLGNCTTRQIVGIFRDFRVLITDFAESATKSAIELPPFDW